MQLNLNNKTALITGASQGIGKEIAIQLAKEGTQVILTSNHQSNLDEVVNEIKANGGAAIAFYSDLTIQHDIDALLNQIASHHYKVDILINNVGSIGRVGKFAEFAADEWLSLFKLNVMSGIQLSKSLVPVMVENSWGRIIFIASERAIEPGIFLSPYAMTKAAILSVAKSLANEFGQYGITVNCISPGVILTPAWDDDAQKANQTREQYAAQFCENIISKQKLGTPMDIAPLVSFLCSDLARWITGSNLRIDGGAIKNIQI